MVNKENNPNIRGPIKALRARSERRQQEARDLVESYPVAVLKEKVLNRDPNAKITVTKTRFHPLAKVKVEAELSASYKDSFIYASTGNIPVQVISGKKVEISYLSKRHGGNHGIIVNSGNGEDLIPNEADPNEVSNIINAAVENPLPFERMNRKFSQRTRRSI